LFKPRSAIAVLNAEPCSQSQKGENAMRPARTFSFLLLCLLLIALPAWISPAAAQQQEKRIALVVGDGAYGKAPLATAANDAGLIAQTLQAAGFDVIGARDLDGDTLRKSFRDFIQKAQSAGPNTVAMVYLAGYGVQLGGENYFIPVDSSISRDTDIPIEGLRISDYTRQLGSLPLKASVIVLDAAREQPFIEGGQQQIASGLALVEPENNMLIAFNAAPGTVAPGENGNYGLYAQSLAEMIRTGGLSLPDVFDRVRLRVNENSKGAQIPWDAQKIQVQFSFFDRAPDAPPAQAPADQVAAIRSRPIRDLSVQDAYAACLERDTLQGYEDFVAAYPSDPLARRVRAIIAARREAITWRRTYLIDSPQAYWSYLRRYPHGPHAWDARRRLAILSAALEPPPSFAVVDYDVPPPPPEEIVIVDRPVIYFGDPVFAFVPPPPPPVFFLPPPPPEFVVLAPPFAPVGLFILPQPVFVPIPVYVRPPVYVAPPPNNIIYNNIHNTTVINNVINQPPPAAAPGNPQAAVAAAASGKAVGAAPPPPPSVHQAALSIQKNPTPQLTPSQQAFVANPTAKPGTPNLVKTNAPAAAPNPAPATPPQNALPGSKAGTPLPQTGKGTTPPGPTPPGPAPSAKLAPNTPAPLPSPSGAASPGAHPNAKLTPPQTPPGSPPPKTGSSAPSANVAPSAPSHAAPPPPTPSGPSRPSAKLSTPPPPPPPPPKPEIKQHAAPPSPPAARVAPSPPAAHAPPPQIHAPPPPVAHAPPPQIHAPPPPVAHSSPPPVAHAPPPPPPPRAALPPPPRAAPPPPPPVAHAAPPPPPRPPPPQAAAPRKCKPGERC
jgi:uncharacterized caspase-like protein